MLKAIGLIQLSIAPLFVIPAMSGQEEVAPDLEAQLDATKRSIEYLAGLRSSVSAGESAAVSALKSATEAPNITSRERDHKLANLQADIARLRFSLEKLLEDPTEVAAISAMPPKVREALGLGTASAPSNSRSNPIDPSNRPTSSSPSGAESAPATRTRTTVTPYGAIAGTTGLDASLRSTISGAVGPLDQVSKTSRRKGGEAVPLESRDYVADPLRLGRLLVRAGRAAEAVEVLERQPERPAVQYWLARAYQEQDRGREALDLFRAVAANEDVETDREAATYARYAQQDLEFLEFKLELESRSKGSATPR